MLLVNSIIRRSLVGMLLLAVSSVWCAVVGNHCAAIAFDDSESELDFKEMKSLSLRVVDSDGNPIANAKVRPYALRAVGDTNAHYFWPTSNIGEPPVVHTDEEGLVKIPYPVRFGNRVQPLESREVTFSVSHIDHISVTMNSSTTIEQATASLVRGSRVRISGVDEQGNAITEFGVLMPNVDWRPSEWPIDEEGYRSNSAIRSGNWQMLAVQPKPDGNTLFSDLTTIRIRRGQSLRFSKIVLRPGVRVEGRLDNAVPRPIQNGIVIATFAPKVAGESYEEKDPTLTWSDKVDIQPDGTFTIPSAPRGGVVQMIAICDGWLCKSDHQNGNQGSVIGQNFDVESEIISPELVMEPTGTLEVVCKDNQGNPLSDVGVATWPNQKYFMGGSTILGSGYQSISFIDTQLNPSADVRPPTLGDDRYSVKSNAEGLAVLRNVPIGTSEYLAIGSQGYRLPKQAGGEQYVPFKLEDVQPLKIELTLEKVGE